MDVAETVAKYCRKYGRRIERTDGGGAWYALVEPLRYKNKMYMSGEPTPAGRSENSWFRYIGPSDELPERSETVFLRCGTKLYSVEKAEPVYFGGQPAYVWAVLRDVT